MERALEPDALFEPVVFDLATGAKVRVTMGEVWDRLSASDRRLRITSTLYFAIRIQSDEDTNPRRLTQHTEFRAGKDFEQIGNRRIWGWLTDLVASRHRYAFNSVQDFIEEFADKFDELSVTSDDAANFTHNMSGAKELTYEDPPRADFPQHDFASEQDEDAPADTNEAG